MMLILVYFLLIAHALGNSLTAPFTGQTTQSGWIAQLSSTNANDEIDLNSAGTGPTLAPKHGMVLINGTVLGAAAVTITFANIPQIYNHLYIVTMVRTSSAGKFGDTSLSFNGDFAGNYPYETNSGENTSPKGAYSAGWVGCYAGTTVGNGATANFAAVSRCIIPMYTQTTFYKGCHCQSSEITGVSTDARSRMIASTWKNTNAITSIDITDGTSGISFMTGSAFYLYGIL